MFELNKVGKSTYFISCRTNMGIYKINSTDVCLIDSGNNDEYGENVLKIINDNAWKLKIIINTHSHADHIGGNNYLQKKTGCQIYTPDEECAYTNYPHLEPAFLYGGYPYKEIRTELFSALPSNAQRLEASILPNGLKTVRLDGHTFAMVAVKTSDEVWFLADSIVSEFILNKYHISFVVDVKKHLESIDKVKALKGKIFIPSHAKPTEDIIPLAELNRLKISEIAKIIKEICVCPITIEDIVKNLFDRYGMNINYIQHTLITATTRSYISFLYDRGELSAEFLNNKLCWKSV